MTKYSKTSQNIMKPGGDWYRGNRRGAAGKPTRAKGRGKTHNSGLGYLLG